MEKAAGRTWTAEKVCLATRDATTINSTGWVGNCP